ncbi:hypothetical protein BDZ45DRAFT_673095 [Acephala macrosclerotiorum]|nr:hypothetical protein BDZ45DRAFT_673095 [Acephala macrosclerotiorum]
MHLEETNPQVFGIFANWLSPKSCTLFAGFCSNRCKAIVLSTVQDNLRRNNTIKPSPKYLMDYCVKSSDNVQCPKSYPTELLVDITNTTRTQKRAKSKPKSKTTRSCRWMRLAQDLMAYAVDEDTNSNIEQRHRLSDGIKGRDAEAETPVEETFVEISD